MKKKKRKRKKKKNENEQRSKWEVAQALRDEEKSLNSRKKCHLLRIKKCKD